MQIVSLEQAKDHLAELIEKAIQGEPFQIALEGKPAV